MSLRVQSIGDLFPQQSNNETSSSDISGLFPFSSMPVQDFLNDEEFTEALRHYSAGAASAVPSTPARSFSDVMGFGSFPMPPAHAPALANANISGVHLASLTLQPAAATLEHPQHYHHQQQHFQQQHFQPQHQAVPVLDAPPAAPTFHLRPALVPTSPPRETGDSVTGTQASTLVADEAEMDESHDDDANYVLTEDEGEEGEGEGEGEDSASDTAPSRRSVRFSTDHTSHSTGGRGRSRTDLTLKAEQQGCLDFKLQSGVVVSIQVSTLDAPWKDFLKSFRQLCRTASKADEKEVKTFRRRYQLRKSSKRGRDEQRQRQRDLERQVQQVAQTRLSIEQILATVTPLVRRFLPTAAASQALLTDMQSTLSAVCQTQTNLD